MKFTIDEKAEDILGSYESASREERVRMRLAVTAHHDYWARILYAMSEIAEG